MWYLTCASTYDPCYGFSVIKKGTEVTATKHPLDMYYKLYCETTKRFLGTISEYELNMYFRSSNRKAI
jgi:hypothetical protein